METIPLKMKPGWSDYLRFVALILRPGPSRPQLAATWLGFRIGAVALLMAGAVYAVPGVTREEAIRTFGTMLSLSPFALLWVDRFKVARAEGIGFCVTLRAEIENIAREARILPPKVIDGSVASLVGGADMRGGVHLHVRKGASLEERVAFLEQQRIELEKARHKLSGDFRDEKEERRKAEERERSERENADRRLASDLKVMRIGNVHFDRIGLWIFAVGLVVVTWSARIDQVLFAR